MRTTQAEFPVLDPQRRPLGILTRNAIFQASNAGTHGAHIGDVMQPEMPVVPLGAPLEKALNALYQGRAHAVAVVGKNEEMLGYITRENLGEFLVLSTTQERR